MKARMNLSKVGCVVGGVVVGLLASMPAVQAQTADDLPQEGPTGPGIPEPEEVWGKEYSDLIDRNANGLGSPTQTLLWDGFGNVADGFKYDDQYEVDAMANVKDHLFDEVIANEAALLFSTAGDPNIYVEGIGGDHDIWATPAQINAAENLPNDVDGLEVWGGSPDANRYSLIGDPGDISVWEFSGTFPFSNPLFTTNQIGQAIGLNINFWGQLDVDALMTYDDHIMFSIAPIAGFDGGEIWTWNGVNGVPAQFLNHGGHVWDTHFDVKGTFGTVSENINALEAVATPEPTSVLALFAVGALGAVSLRKRSRK